MYKLTSSPINIGVNKIFIKISRRYFSLPRLHIRIRANKLLKIIYLIQNKPR
jgi:hypothetical protein